MSVILKTTLGDMTFTLFTKERPRSSLNFLKLCKVKFYNFVLFHKVERNFVAQTGDPTGTGRGGESIFCRLYGEQAKLFEGETKPILKHKRIGTLSMVNDGNSRHGSQFFITLNEDLDYLNGVHTVFGELTDGEDVIKKINDTICDKENRPYKDIRICHTVILDDPFDDPKGLEIPDRSPEPTKDMLKSSRIAADEEIDDTKGKSLDEIEEEIQEKEASARATILEMVGDIPDAEVKPPDNVLFVCKLNPVTTSEDLEIIFSRFGKILSCEVIKDRKTGDSLQYAFIEFENPKDCENAYFKMDNVLIDDRRIHVDFSQSVSKIKWKGKGKGVEYLDEKKKNFQQTKEKYEPKPKFALKDKAKPRESKHDLVFEDDKSSISSENIEKERTENRKHRKRKKSCDKSTNGREQHKTKSRRHRSPSSSCSSSDDYRRRKHKTSHSRGKSSKSRKREKRSRSRSSGDDRHLSHYKSSKKSKREKQHKTSSRHHSRSSS